MKAVLIIMIISQATYIHAPYEVEFYKHGIRMRKTFYIQYNSRLREITRINLDNYIVDTLHLQPERSKREDHVNGCGALNSIEI